MWTGGTNPPALVRMGELRLEILVAVGTRRSSDTWLTSSFRHMFNSRQGNGVPQSREVGWCQKTTLLGLGGETKSGENGEK